MPWGPISRLPAGLLGALFLKSNGQNPEALGDIVSPILELFPFYANDGIQRQVATAANQVPTIGFKGLNPATFPFFGASQTDWRYVRALSVSMNAATVPVAGETIEFRPAYISPQGMFTGPVPGRFIQGAGGRQDLVVWENFWLPPLAQVGLSVERSTIAAGTMSMDIALQAWTLPS